MSKRTLCSPKKANTKRLSIVSTSTQFEFAYKVSLHQSIQHLNARRKAWECKLKNLKILVAQDLKTPGVQYIVIGATDRAGAVSVAESIYATPELRNAVLVSFKWIERCCESTRLIDPSPFILVDFQGFSPAPVPKPEEPSGPHKHYAAWLGHWQPRYKHIKDINELMLQATFCMQHCRAVGNGGIAAGLQELCKYEEALESNPQDDHSQARAYARAAASVCACSFRIAPEMSIQHLCQCVPHVRNFTAGIIQQLAATGSCEHLERFRQDQPVKDSSGLMRQGTDGAATRHLFKGLPGVGAVTAQALYSNGFRSYEQLAQAVREPGPALPCGVRLSRGAAFSALHWQDLRAEHVPAEDVQEMMQVVAAAIESISGTSGWHVELAGGGRRGKAGHDVDLLVTHETAVEGVAQKLLDHLLAQGRMVGHDEGFCMVQSGKAPRSLQQARDFVVRGQAVEQHRAGDMHDHVLGMFVTASGRLRRLDVILVSPEQWAFALLGWSGSKQFLRFLKTHASNCKMQFTAHCLLRRAAGKGLLLVPEEAAPSNRDSRDSWPPGWDHQRPVKTEQDIFELLNLPYKPPHERCA